MTDCPNLGVRDQLPDLANESLAPAVRVLVIEHLAVCVICTAELVMIREMRSAMIGSTRVVSVASIVSALPRAGVTPISAAPSVRRRNWGSSWRIAAAITVFAAGVGSYATLSDRPPIVPVDTTAPISVADNSNGLALTGTLADLSDAELKSLVADLGTIVALPSSDVDVTTTSISTPPDVIPDSMLRPEGF